MVIVFVDKCRKGNAHPPLPLPEIERVASVKIFIGVTKQTVCPSPNTAINSCAQTLWVLLCRHRQAVVCIKCVVGIYYGSRTTSYWCIHSSYSTRCFYVPPDSPSFDTLCRSADDEQFITTQHVSSSSLAVTVARDAKLQYPPTLAQPWTSGSRQSSYWLTSLRESCYLTSITQYIWNNIVWKFRYVDCV